MRRHRPVGVADVDAPAAGELAVAQHVGALIGLPVDEILRGPVGIRRDLGPAAVRVHRPHQRAEAEQSELRRVLIERAGLATVDR